MDKSIFHIAFGDVAALHLKNAMREGLNQGKIVCFREDFTQGPLTPSFTIEALLERNNYWMTLSDVLYYASDIEAICKSSAKEIQSIAKGAKVVIWKGESAYDMLATMWVTNYLNKSAVEFQLIDLKDALEKEKIVLSDKAYNLGMVPPSFIPQLYKHHSVLHPMFIAKWTGEWHELTLNNGAYIVYEDEELKGVKSTYFDTEILKYITSNMILVKDVIESILMNSDYPLSDITIEKRIRAMIANNDIEYEGKIETMMDYSISIK